MGNNGTWWARSGFPRREVGGSERACKTIETGRIESALGARSERGAG